MLLWLLSGNKFKPDMEPQFPLRAGRVYAHSSDIMAYVLRLFGAMRPNKVVIDFLKPATSRVHLVLQETSIDPADNDAIFTVKLVKGHALQVYRALPMTELPIVDNVDSSNFIACEKYSPQTMEVTSTAHAVADFFYDLNTCMKKHWQQYNYQHRALLVRRMELRLPFSAPTGIAVKGDFKKLKLGAQAWHFTAPTLPEFEFSVIGLYQTA